MGNWIHSAAKKLLTVAAFFIDPQDGNPNIDHPPRWLGKTNNK